MDMLKRALAVLGAAVGLLALLYIVFAWSLTLKNFGLSVEAQLIVQRIIMPLLFVALPVVIALIKPVCRTGLVKENGIACDMGKLGNMRKGVKGAICANPLKNGRVGTVPRNLGMDCRNDLT